MAEVISLNAKTLFSIHSQWRIHPSAGSYALTQSVLLYPWHGKPQTKCRQDYRKVSKRGGAIECGGFVTLPNSRTRRDDWWHNRCGVRRRVSLAVVPCRLLNNDLVPIVTDAAVSFGLDRPYLTARP